MAVSTPTMDSTRSTTTAMDRRTTWGSWGAIIVIAFLVFAAILLMNRPTAVDPSLGNTMMEGQTTSDSVTPTPAPTEVPSPDGGAAREVPVTDR